MQTPDMLHQPYWVTMGPLLVLTVAAFLVMVLEFLFRKGDRRWLAAVSMAGVAGALAVAILHYFAQPQIALNTMVVDPMGNVFSILILIGTLLVLLFSWDYARRVQVPAEHTYLILFAVVGALAMATAVDMITLYVGLELLSVSSYILVAVRRRSARSVEGGVKYLLMGSIGSAVLLYGMSFIYGITGQTSLLEIGMGMQDTWASYPAIVVLSFVLILVGMGVKLALVPFHMWTPDAYDGAPSPISAFVATVSKAAAFIMLLRIGLFMFGNNASDLFYWVSILAAATMIVGNVIALPQRNMKRLLAYSSVAQAGYVLVPVALFGSSTPAEWYGLFDSLSFYLFAYTFMTIGAFAVVHVVARARGTVDSDALIGLYQRSPWLAGALTVFLLSLAGMPLTSGFIGKVYIFADAVHMRGLWLGVLLFVTSVVSFFYYFGWIRKMFQQEPVGDVQPIPAGGLMNTLLGVCVLGTLVLGVAPAALLHVLQVTKWF
ncbi:MAG: NADH-quinone oxidoreductase subunit N [Alicyclobacillus sp.]|nr:NADH-quinone oxidoreductase subunit N [Alicyclobacillus sp.]